MPRHPGGNRKLVEAPNRLTECPYGSDNRGPVQPTSP
ncbi:MAG: hypothetical protein RLZ45_1108, partial [Verrucomicrobiota bacterium]